jgi:hypothetical protein
MSKKGDQKLAALDSNVRKWLKIKGYKLAAIGCIFVPIIGWYYTYHFWRTAIRVHGPDLGKAPGRADIATSADLRRTGMRP